VAPQYEEEYVNARTVLLDALGALGDHRSSAILVGAQAIYIHAGEATFGMAPYTTDADIAINPRSLNKKPPIEQAMKNAGFRHGEQPGVWLGTDNIQVDWSNAAPAHRAGAARILRGARAIEDEISGALCLGCRVDQKPAIVAKRF
jgi:hypothetical protein